jgi:hypothetical protein
VLPFIALFVGLGQSGGERRRTNYGQLAELEENKLGRDGDEHAAEAEIEVRQVA